MWTRLLCFASFLLASGCGEQPGVALKRYEDSRVAMGTSARVVLYAKDETLAREALGAALDRIEQLDRVLSDYREESEVRALERKGRGTHRVSDMLYAALRNAEIHRVSALSAFSVTIGPLVQLWRKAARTGVVPNPGQIDAARQTMSWYVLHAGNRVELMGEAMRFDFGGMGKGFAADWAMLELTGKGIGAALVDIGGDLRIGRPPPGRKGWAVVVPGCTELVMLHDCGVAASGHQARGFTIDGIRYSHAIDPETGRAMTDKRRVTVLAPDAVTADVQASAYSVMEPARALRDVSSFTDLHLWISWEQGGKVHVLRSPGFPAP